MCIISAEEYVLKQHINKIELQGCVYSISPSIIFDDGTRYTVIEILTQRNINRIEKHNCILWNSLSDAVQKCKNLNDKLIYITGYIHYRKQITEIIVEKYEIKE
jgi:hypothetical protein